MILLGHIILALAIFSISAYFKARTPGNMNTFFGYRTPASMRNDETWKEANRFSADLQFKFAILFIVFEVFSYLLVGGLSSFYLSCGFLTITSIAVIPFTEFHLRKKYNSPEKRQIS